MRRRREKNVHFFDGGCERQKENNVSLCAILVAEKDEDENVFGTNTAAAGNPSEIYVSMYGIFLAIPFPSFL